MHHPTRILIAPVQPRRPTPWCAPLFARPPSDSENPFPLEAIQINWERLIAKRPLALATVDAMPRYLLKPEVLALLAAEPDPRYRLLFDLMWSTGARVSEVLALTPASFVDNGYDVGVIFRTLKSNSGRDASLPPRKIPQRFVPIVDDSLKERIANYLWAGRFRKAELLFTMARQTVTRRIHHAVERAGGAPFNITSHTLRHSFAIHLILHGRPLKYVAQLLGHKTTESTEIYTNVLTSDGGHFMVGIDFH